jgi:hypothetical protein
LHALHDAVTGDQVDELRGIALDEGVVESLDDLGGLER